MAKAAATTAPPQTPTFTSGYKSLVLTLLVMVYTVNFIDRTIIGTIGQAIKLDLKLTDTQLGLLQGIAFALLYTALGIPIARLAERWNRVSIISICLVIWSGFTALCGIAGNFTQLMLYRVGVGIGEAGCSPPAHSLIADYYEPRRRATALSIYSFGIPLGTMFGAVAGGWIAQHLSWRIAFMVVGVPGVILAILMKLLVKEPPRGWSDRDSAVAADERPFVPDNTTAHAVHERQGQNWFTRELAELWKVAKLLFGKWSFLNMTIGVTLASFAGYGAGGFIVPYFIRNFGLSLTVVGLIFGLIGGVANGAGTLLGGFITDRAAKRGEHWYALVPAIGLAIATPLYILVFMQSDWKMAAALLLIPGIFHYTYLGPTFGVMHNLVQARQRATATALLFFVLNLIALGGGPPFTGWVIDQFATHLFAQHNLGSFFTLCPGGVGAKGVAAGIDAVCKASMAQGTRYGEIVTTLIYAWAALHYALGAIGLAKDLRAARGGADR
ncbi:MAG: spinster family MFS transporter [Parcubacteria group bacterium]